MSGVSLSRPCTGSKTLGRCNGGARAELVDLTDVDTDTFSNVIIIDVPESIPPKKFQVNTTALKKDKRRRPPRRNIIFIDDDESNEKENDHRFFHDPSPSMTSCSTSKNAEEPLDEIVDDCQFVRANTPPVKLSKCKRTYSGKAPIQNHYGLASDLESSSSDNDEVMVDYCSSSDNDEVIVASSGKLEEQWHKAAYLKRKNDSGGPSGLKGISSKDFSPENDVSPEKEDVLPESPKDDDYDEGHIENCLTTERERMKESSEYKKAIEEEWAARQRTLAIQAAEARKEKLLKRREKAETMRLLEMKKRQKQRVEEMRETQKKDVEAMNMKELIRAEVRKELSNLEMTCPDMATVLRGLGINVGGGTSPEVRVAYKKALLTFHPDRASRSDLRQQVEAEEKFKLISRMKDKYLPTLGQ